MILVSACLARFNCRYDGSSNTHDRVVQLVKEGKALPVCPEQLGGLTTPRDPVEMTPAARVVTTKGKDVTDEFY